MPFVTVEHFRGNAWISLNRPPDNVLNPTLVHSLLHAFGEAIADRDIRGIAIAGSGRYFSAGADLPFFLRQVMAGDLNRIEQFASQLHQLCDAISGSGKPVVAAIHSVALGAGLELALACDRIVVTRRATVGLPETGLCVCPGSGGTQRLPRRVGSGLAKWLIYTGHFLSGLDAFQIGVVDRCVNDDELQSSVEAEIASLLAQRDLPTSPVRVVPEALRGLESVFNDLSIAELMNVGPHLSAEWDGRSRRAVKTLASRSQRILWLAERLMDQGRELSLPDALKLEVAAIRTMFDDAEVGPALRAALDLKRPQSD